MRNARIDRGTAACEADTLPTDLPRPVWSLIELFVVLFGCYIFSQITTVIGCETDTGANRLSSTEKSECQAGSN